MPAPYARRTQLLDEETMVEIKTLFGQANNAFRWLNFNPDKISIFTFMRALRGETCREADLAMIEGTWEDFKQVHNITPATFENLPEIIQMRGLTRSGGSRVKKPRDGEYVEEDVSLGENDVFF